MNRTKYIVCLTLVAACLAACGSSRRGPRGGAGDSGIRPPPPTMCTTRWVCEDGTCTCSVGGDVCCDPDICGVATPRSCETLCDSCTPSPGDSGVSPRDTGTPPRDSATPMPPPTIVCGSPAPCWAECTAEGASLVTCESRCGLRTESDEVGCGLLCALDAINLATCASYCDFTTPCGQQACAEVCIATDAGLTTCQSYCDFDTAEGEVGCADVCIATGVGLGTCESYCRFETAAGRAACRRVCTATGVSETTCSSYCE